MAEAKGGMFKAIVEFIKKIFAMLKELYTKLSGEKPTTAE